MTTTITVYVVCGIVLWLVLGYLAGFVQVFCSDPREPAPDLGFILWGPLPVLFWLILGIIAVSIGGTVAVGMWLLNPVATWARKPWVRLQERRRNAQREREGTTP